jgi:hypothetical protein
MKLPDCGHVPTYDGPSRVARVLLEGVALPIGLPIGPPPPRADEGRQTGDKPTRR